MGQCSSLAIGCQTKSPVPGVGYLLPSGWSGVFQGLPQRIQAIAIALSCSPQCDGKTLLLKTPDTLVTGHGEPKLVPTMLIASSLLPSFNSTGVECYVGRCGGAVINILSLLLTLRTTIKTCEGTVVIQVF